MGVTPSSEDHEGNMAKRQMFKTAEYAAEIFDNIQDGDEFPAWIQSKMTKIADYIGAVKHYLEYDHVMGEDLTKKQIKGRDDDAKSIMKSTKKQYGKEEGESAAYAIATNCISAVAAIIFVASQIATILLVSSIAVAISNPACRTAIAIA